MTTHRPLSPALLLTALLTLLLASCHSSRHTVRGSQGAVVTGTTARSVDADVAVRLVETARQWIGTPYKYAGNDRRGVDCSGLTCNVFSTAAGIKLPRNSHQQKEYCLRIDRNALQPGDLVFFVNSRGGKRVNHVGLYVGSGRMIHSSSSRGVIESDITSGYWDDHYFASGRVEAVTYASRGTTPRGGKPARKSHKPEKEKQKKPKKDKKPKTVRVTVPAPPTDYTEIPLEALPASPQLPAGPVPGSPAPVVPVTPSPAPPSAPATEEPDSVGGGWFD